MKFSKKIKILALVFIFVCFVGETGFNNIANAQRGRCGDQTFCWDGGLYPPCIPLPTSLPVVSSSWSGGYGFRVGSKNCGGRRCYWIFACACGPGLGVEICTPDSPSGSYCNQENQKQSNKVK